MKKRHLGVLRSFRELHNDARGAVLIWISILVPVVFGLVGLAIDGARYLNLHSNLQEVADAAALAGAYELDGSSDSITRASDRAVNFLVNNPTWSDISASGPQIVASGADAPTFYGPGIDTATTNPKNAAFIKVTTIDRGLNPSFISAVASSLAVYTRATATAKASYSVCKPLQSFVCNPYEASETNPGNASNWKDNVFPGDMMLLAGGTGGAPGNWGLIRPPGANGNPNNQAPFWAQTTPSSCAASSAGEVGAEVDTGNNSQFAEPGMNVRFDNPTAAGDQSIAAPIVIDGLTATGNNYNCRNSVSATPTSGSYTFQQTDVDATAYDNYCNATVSGSPVGSCPLPRDRVLNNFGGTGGWQPSMIGTGPTPEDLDAYWTNHHTGLRPAELDTRYKIYLAEAAGTAAFTAGSEAKEPHLPACTSSEVALPDRRLIQIAIVDCDYWSINGASNTLPVITLVAEFFMTEPATTSGPPSTHGRIYGELVGTSQVNDPNGVIYQIVQLVR